MQRALPGIWQASASTYQTAERASIEQQACRSADLSARVQTLPSQSAVASFWHLLVFSHGNVNAAMTMINSLVANWCALHHDQLILFSTPDCFATPQITSEAILLLCVPRAHVCSASTHSTLRPHVLLPLWYATCHGLRPAVHPRDSLFVSVFQAPLLQPHPESKYY